MVEKLSVTSVAILLAVVALISILGTAFIIGSVYLGGESAQAGAITINILPAPEEGGAGSVEVITGAEESATT